MGLYDYDYTFHYCRSSARVLQPAPEGMIRDSTGTPDHQQTKCSVQQAMQ